MKPQPIDSVGSGAGITPYFITLFSELNRDSSFCADHEHDKVTCRGVRGMVMWLTPSFGDRVEHDERLLKVARGILLCAWFVK